MSVCSLPIYTGGITFGLFGPTMFSPFHVASIARAFDAHHIGLGDVTLRQAAITSAVVGTGITISAYYYDNLDAGAGPVSDFEFEPINGTVFGKALGVKWIDHPSGYFPLDMLTHEDDGFFCVLDSPLKDLDSAGLAYCHKYSEDEHKAVEFVQYQHAGSTIGVPSIHRQVASIASAAPTFTSSDGALVFWRPTVTPIGDWDDIRKGEIEVFDPDWPFADFFSEFGGHLLRSLTRELEGFLRELDHFWQMIQHDYAILNASLVNTVNSIKTTVTDISIRSRSLLIRTVEWIKTCVDLIKDIGRSFVFAATSVGPAGRYAFLVIAALLGLLRQVIVSMELDVVFLAMVLNLFDSMSATTAPLAAVSNHQELKPAEDDIPVSEVVSHATPSLNPKAAPFVPRPSLSAPTPIPVGDFSNENRRRRRRCQPTRK